MLLFVVKKLTGIFFLKKINLQMLENQFKKYKNKNEAKKKPLKQVVSYTSKGSLKSFQQP